MGEKRWILVDSLGPIPVLPGSQSLTQLWDDPRTWILLSKKE